MQLKMSKRLQGISSMALNHMTMDMESDYDTDDMDATVIDTHRQIHMTDSMGSEGNPLADLHKFRLQASDLGPDSSDGEGFLNDFDEGTLKRRTSKKHRASKKVTNGGKPDISEKEDMPHLIGDEDNSDGAKTEGTSSSLSSGDKKEMDSSIESDDFTSTLSSKSSSNVNGAVVDDATTSQQ